MDKSKAKERIDYLVEELKIHNQRYYEFNNPIISDFEFDKMLKELSELEKAYPEFIRDDSPTLRVGSDLESNNNSPFEQIPHKNLMLSLANTYNIGELRDFDAKVAKSVVGNYTYNCELKFDGTGINLIYKNGMLIHALTRGDGTIGDDIIRNIKTIKSIPHKLKEGSGYPPEFEIRGEIYMPFEAFDRLNKERELNEDPLFANPRNAASGSLKILDSKIVAKRGLQCVLYHLIAPDLEISEHSKALKAAAEWGLPISEYSKVCDNIDQVIEYINEWDTKRKELPFPTDGVVVKVNQFALQNSLGYTSKTPRWAVAYKFKPEEALTKILSIDYQVGRTGAVTPVANLEPVLLSGTTVKRATLHNAEQMQLLDIHIGDYVYIEKGGEIIPKITSVELKKREPYFSKAIFPTHCPVCKSTLCRDEDEAKFYCPNSDNCPPQIIGKFIHFTSRKALNINVGEIALEQMHNRGYINRFEDLYTISDLALLSLDKWKEKSVSNFHKSLENSKLVPFERVLYALGIKYIGETSAKNLARRFENIDNLAQASRDELIDTEDIGDTIADSLIDYFKSENNQITIAKLKEIGLKFEVDKSIYQSDELKGKTIVISGTYSIPRETMKLYIEAHGGKVSSSISKSTSYLLAGDKAGEEKIKKADRLGIPIISEQEFYAIAYPTNTESNISNKPEDNTKKNSDTDTHIDIDTENKYNNYTGDTSAESEELTLF